MREKQAATNVAAESKHSATLIPADNGMDASNIFIFLLRDYEEKSVNNNLL